MQWRRRVEVTPEQHRPVDNPQRRLRLNIETSQSALGRRPHVVGLVGGVASGKSLVADQFRQLGAAWLDADRAGHQVLRLPQVRETLVRRWGTEILNHEGEVNRSAVARRVFGGTEQAKAELAFLEQVSHPEIRRVLQAEIAALDPNRVPVAVLDAAVMLKSGWNTICDTIVYVDATRTQRLSRALQRGWSEEEFHARERNQESLDEKRRYAGSMIDNTGSIEQTRAQVEALYQRLLNR